jgi:hypothetical protein
MAGGLPVPVLTVGLATVGVLLAGPWSVALATASWPRRTPRAALVLWQAMCLGAGLSVIGAVLVPAIYPLGDNIAEALWAGWRQLWHRDPFNGLALWQAICLVVAVAITAVLLGMLVHCLVLAVQRRRSHRSLLDLLAASASESTTDERRRALLADVRVLDHPSPVAYSLPGWHSRVVLSAGMLELLDPDELAAVLEHERAHLRTRHDLMILPFQSWVEVLGAVPGVRMARQSVAELAEMLADDVAARRTRGRVLATALTKVTLACADRAQTGDPGRALSGAESIGSSAAATTTVTARVTRLVRPTPLPKLVTVGVYLLSALLLAVPTGLLLVGWS